MTQMLDRVFDTRVVFLIAISSIRDKNLLSNNILTELIILYNHFLEFIFEDKNIYLL